MIVYQLKKKDYYMLGERYGKLIVLERAGSTPAKKRTWLCRCDCGKTSIVATGQLKSGRTKSCGCLVKFLHYTHGMHKTGTYQTWADMKRRCLNPKDRNYKNYGGRGITLDEKWFSFEGFYEDMGVRPEKLTLERIDNNLGYYKENCIWATRAAQNRNKRGCLKYRVSEEGILPC